MQRECISRAGKICRDGSYCREHPTPGTTETAVVIGFLQWHGVCWSIGIEVRGRPCGIVGVLAMLLALGAASSALDALKSLTSSKSSSTGNKDSSSPFDLSGPTSAGPSSPPAPTSGGGSQISPATMSALLAAQGQASAGSTTAASSQSGALKDLFSQIDADSDGKLSKTEFENALGAGGTNVAQADDVFGKMDKDADGSVSLDEMMSALKSGKGGHHHHHVAASDGADDTSGAAGSSSDPLMQALEGTSSTSVTNSDGSTTTSLTYADGSKVTMTSAAAASISATSSYHLIEQMIQRQAQPISSSAIASLSVSA
jgi:EF-hand domain pair